MIIKTGISILLLMRAMNVFAYEEYNNPVDGKTYVTDEWKTYQPENPRIDATTRVQNTGIRLLTTEKEIADNLTVDELGGYIKNIEKQANATIKGLKSNGLILLQVSLNPKEKPVYEMSFQGNLSQEYLQKFYDALQNLKYPEVAVGNVTFQVELHIQKA